ncbi:MAG: glycosyltransferase family 2 protein [Candidatus Hydrogenedens sp.]|nr:glycosyltransferase family 2 protein [Candidatus Hydrogenedentota bacterium]NLF57841.1 glycosyltransferase family 2 protein [Candidatus Hydrogenedens sp.]
MSYPLTHVLVINWNGREHLEDCFSSLLESGGGNYRFVLVDNASTDGSADFVRGRFGQDPRVEVLSLPENLGWSGGNNAGIRAAMAAGADYVFLLNNDTRVAPDALQRVVELAESDPSIGVVAPRMALFGQPFVLNSTGVVCSRAGACWDIGAGRVDGPRWHRHEPVIAACGGACLLRVRALHETGLLPEAFSIYLDDVDLCLRMWDAGHRVLPCPEAVVEHKFSASMGEGARARQKYYLATRNRFYLFLRNLPAEGFVKLLPWMLLAEAKAVGRALLDRRWWAAAAHVRAWAALPAFLPEAGRHRREWRTKGFSKGRFLPMLHRERLFCPEVALPRDGWYPSRTVNGETVQPMSARAWRDVAGGRLRVLSVNCYPSLGPTRVRMEMDGRVLGTVACAERAEMTLDVPAGRLELIAETLHCAEDTGGVADFGGWLRVEPHDTGEHSGNTRPDNLRETLIP